MFSVTQPLACDDCGRQPHTSPDGPPILVHADTCPVGNSDRDQQADDLLWLREHPGQVRDRAPVFAERETLRLAGAPRAVVRAARVQVHAARGGRLRLFVHAGRTLAASADVSRGGAA